MLKHYFFLCNEIKEIDRYNNLTNQIKNYNLTNYSFFTHIWGDEITNDIRNKWVKSDWTMRHHGRYANIKPLNNGEISLFLNHIECLRKIRNEYNDGYFIIFESDALFYNNFNQKLNYLLELAKKNDDWDVINIGEGHNDIPKSGPIKDSINLYKENIHRCTEGLLWNYNGICKFLEYFEKENDIDGPIDTKMDVLSTYV